MAHAIYRSKELLQYFLTLEGKLITIRATCFIVKKRLIMPKEGPYVSNGSQNKQ